MYDLIFHHHGQLWSSQFHRQADQGHWKMGQKACRSTMIMKHLLKWYEHDDWPMIWQWFMNLWTIIWFNMNNSNWPLIWKLELSLKLVNDFGISNDHMLQECKRRSLRYDNCLQQLAQQDREIAMYRFEGASASRRLEQSQADAQVTRQFGWPPKLCNVFLKCQTLICIRCGSVFFGKMAWTCMAIDSFLMRLMD